MFETESERVGSGGGALVASTWGLAFLPLAVFFFNLRPATDFQWLWMVWSGLLVACPLAAISCAMTLTRRDVRTMTRIWARIGAGISLLNLSGFNFHGI